jgi:hypothetical protein
MNINFSIFLIYIVIISSFYCKLENLCIDDNCFYKKEKKIFNNNKNEFNENYEKSHNNFFTFLYKAFMSRININFQNYFKYTEGLKKIFNSMTNIVHNYDTKDDIKVSEFRNLFEINNQLNNKNEKILLKQQQNLENNYPYNNSNLSSLRNCKENLPNLTVDYFKYFCNNIQVKKEEYNQLKTDESNNCQFYKNEDTICINPVNYNNLNEIETKIFCKIKTLKELNNNIDLLQNKDKFYYEYFNTPILNKLDSPFNFEISILCGQINLNESNSYYNYMLSSDYDYFADYNIKNINIPKNFEYNFTIESLNDRNSKIFDYFIKEDDMVIFDDISLELSFSIYEMNWVLPIKTKTHKINNDIKNFLNNNESFKFLIDLDNLDSINEDIYNNSKFPKMINGNAIFYEIKIYDKNKNQIKFFSYQGIINNNK